MEMSTLVAQTLAHAVAPVVFWGFFPGATRENAPRMGLQLTCVAERSMLCVLYTRDVLSLFDATPRSSHCEVLWVNL